jgi:hypothetical protein
VYGKTQMSIIARLARGFAAPGFNYTTRVHDLSERPGRFCGPYPPPCKVPPTRPLDGAHPVLQRHTLFDQTRTENGVLIGLKTELPASTATNLSVYWG